MDLEAKKKALRMITDGIYVLTSAHAGKLGCSTVTWLTQTSFAPPLVAVGVKKDSFTHGVLEKSKAFAIHILAKDQQKVAQDFFKHADPVGNTVAGYEFVAGKTGSPILDVAPAYFECKVVDQSAVGDHTTVIGEVVEAGVRRADQPLALRDTPWQYGG